MVVTIEGRRGSVKGKGKLHVVGIEYLQIQEFRATDRDKSVNAEQKAQFWGEDISDDQGAALLPVLLVISLSFFIPEFNWKCWKHPTILQDSLPHP